MSTERRAGGETGEATFRASCVAIDGRGVLIMGRSGRGKSALALALIAFGAELISDDLTRLTRSPTGLIAHAPIRMRGAIEARFVGILEVPCRSQVPLAFAIDLDHEERERLPPHRTVRILGQDIRVLHGVGASHFAASVFLMARNQNER